MALHRISPAGHRPAPPRSLAKASDARLVERLRRGEGAAFEAIFDRYHASLLALARSIVGSAEEAEDAVQLTFLRAYAALVGHDAGVVLRPWLYTICRNVCLSLLRARREHAAELADIPTRGLAATHEEAADLRQLLGDLAELPHEQRTALVLAELGGLDHGRIAAVLGCSPAKVKSLVFRARRGLLARRQARETPCREIREQLTTLRKGSLRRVALKHHLASCPECAGFREELRRRRGLLSVLAPVAPAETLRQALLDAGRGGGSAGSPSAAAGLSGLAAKAGLSSALGLKAVAANVGVLAVTAAGAAPSSELAPVDAPGAPARAAAPERAGTQARAPRAAATRPARAGEGPSAERRQRRAPARPGGPRRFPAAKRKATRPRKDRSGAPAAAKAKKGGGGPRKAGGSVRLDDPRPGPGPIRSPGLKIGHAERPPAPGRGDIVPRPDDDRTGGLSGPGRADGSDDGGRGRSGRGPSGRGRSDSSRGRGRGRRHGGD